MHKCILCSNSTTQNSNTVTYHTFPRNLVRRNQWVEHLKVGKCFDWQRICSDHFSDNDFKPGEKRLLRSNAIPILPTNEMHENKETPESSDLVNNSANSGSPRRSSRKIKKTRQLLENETNKKVKKLPTASTTNQQLTVAAQMDSRTQTPMSNSIANRKMKRKKRRGFIGLRFFDCTVKSCMNSYPCSSVSFFSYPDSDLRDVWIENCGTREIVEGARSKKKKHLKVCGKHFEKSMFINPKKKNRLKPNAVPTLHIGKVSNTSQSPTFGNNEMECTSIEESNSTNENLLQPSVELSVEPYVEPSIELSVEPSIELSIEPSTEPSIDETMTNESNMTTSTKIAELCCVPGCISNNAAKNEIPEVVFLFVPSIEDINTWSSALGIPITNSSRVCELHFKPQDFLDLKSLALGAVPSVLKPHEYSFHHLSDNFEEGPSKRIRLNSVSTDNLPGTMINNISNQASVISNKNQETESETRSESVPVPIPVPSADESGSRTEKMFSRNSMPISNISQLKNCIHNKHLSVINVPEFDSKGNFKQFLEIIVPIEPTATIPATTSDYESNARIQKMLSNSSVSITMESGDEHNKQLLPVNPTEIINTSILKQTLITEPTGVLSKSSISSSTPNTSQSNLIKILPKTFTNGSVSITLKSNINPSEIDSADIVKPTSLTDNVMSNSAESTFDDPILKNLVNNNSVSITRESSYKQRKPVSTINSTDVFKSPSVTVLPLNRKPGPTDIPSMLTNDSSLTNVNIPEELSSDDKLANPRDPLLKLSVNQLDRSQKEIKLEPMDDYECSIISADNLIMINSEAPVSMTGNINDNVEKTTLIRDISKTVVLPNVFWRSLYHSEQNSTVFIERNELMESVKKVFFKNSLVPMIYINNKRYEYNETIDNKIALENLLSKIDKIQICLGYDGFVHDQCIGYLDSTSVSNRSEVCNRCHSLVEKDFFSKYETEITEKMNMIIQIEKNNIEREHRISEAKKRLQSE